MPLYQLELIIYLWYKYCIVFEYNSAKSAANKDKHGIDFDEAQALWEDDRYIEFPVYSENESRFIIIGKIGVKCWTAIITYRENNIRIISVRRARKDEIELYETY